MKKLIKPKQKELDIYTCYASEPPSTGGGSGGSGGVNPIVAAAGLTGGSQIIVTAIQNIFGC